MIGIVFKFGTEIVEVRVDDTNIFFRTFQLGIWADIGGIKLNKVGVLKEFPDLKDNEDWKSIARQRFKDKIKTMKTKRERADYVINDLKKYGYKPMYEQVQGFRPKKFN